MSDDGEWFAPKRFGYGAGPPIAWQGWALIVGFCAVLAGAGVLLFPRHHEGVFFVIAAAGAIALNVIAAQHTRGGWKWRWGKD